MISNDNLSQAIVRHSSYDKEEFLNLSEQIANSVLDKTHLIKIMKNKEISYETQLKLAKEAIIITWYGRNVNINPSSILGNYGVEQKSRTLWETYMMLFNICLNGGVSYKTNSGRRFTTRKIKNMYRQIYVNTNLWDIVSKEALFINL